MLGTKEFIDLMAQFEKDAKGLIRTGSIGFAREPKEEWAKRVYYCDGNINSAFIMYMQGYSYSKAINS